MSRIAANLLALRRRLALSQAQVGMAVGVRQATVSAWEQGQAEPGAKTIGKLAELFEVSPEQLLDEDLTKRKQVWADHSPPADATEASRRVRALALRLEGDMHEWGGTERDIDAARQALATDETVRMMARVAGNELGDSFGAYVRFVEALRLAFAERIVRRQDEDERPIRELEPLVPVPRSTAKPAKRVAEGRKES